MSVQELQKYTAVSKYARWVQELSRREVWPETTARYQGMLERKYPHRAEKIAEACRSITDYEVMPSMRGLQFGGAPIEQKNCRLYNCTGSYCDRLPFWGEAFYMLLCGSGVGTSVQEHHLASLPGLSRKRTTGVKLPRRVFRPSDSIEGWADCAHVLTSSYFEEPVRGFEDYHDCEVEFDLSNIRPKGSLLSFGIGKAPGPEPLSLAIERNRSLLNRALSEGLTRLNSIYAYDYFMHWADSVVSGGVRRSACIVMFDLWDMLMRMAKTGNWRAVNPQRARSNNTVLLVRGEVSFEEFSEVFRATKEFGEPGFYWTDDKDSLGNPCLEISFFCRLLLALNDPGLKGLLKSYQGPVKQVGNHVYLSGVQMCNLTTINAKTLKGSSRAEREQDFYRRCDQASRLGTWQAGFTHFPYLGEVSERIVQREALLGVSIAGIMHHPDLLLDPSVLEHGAKIVLASNEDEAPHAGVRPCARGTCVKPDGNSASALGCFSGASAGKFRRGMRISQVNKMEAPYQHFRSINPEACEESFWSNNGTDDCIRFPVEYEGLLEEQLTAVQFLEHIRTIQNHWVRPGKVVERCTQPWLMHNVSNTVRVRDHEWDGVKEHIYRHRECYGGVSFIGAFGDRDYAQAPFTAAFLPNEQEEMYGIQAVAQAEELVRAAEAAFDRVPALWDACDLALGRWHDQRSISPKQAIWHNALARYAQEHFRGDVRRATYALKDWWNYDKWSRLRESFVPVDYSQMVETDNGVSLQSEVACGGGACDLS